MAATEYPFQMIGGVPVVTAPAQIDSATSDELRSILLEWQGRGHATAVVDMTGTIFCDVSGLRTLLWAHERAVADGGGLRLVTSPDDAFTRISTVTGLDGIPHFATLKQALATVPAAASRPRHRGSGQEPATAPPGPPAQVREDEALIGDSRSCEQCGAAFVPAREHARFCTSGCRAAWNRDHLGDPALDARALTWSMAAMSEATVRLPGVSGRDQPQSFAAIGEAVWWITMVDATLVRHHPGAYDAVMAERGPAERRLINDTLAGLRFVRNWISRAAGPGELVEIDADGGSVSRWTWKRVPEPALGWLPPRAQAWERARHQAYQARLAGCTLGKTFGQAVAFLTLTGASAASDADAGPG